MSLLPSKDTFVNTLLGLLLLLVFALPLMLCLIVLFFVNRLIAPETARFLVPLRSLTSDEIASLLFICFLSPLNAIQNLRNRYWTNAFLSAALLPMTIVACFANTHAFNFRAFVYIPLMLLVAVLPSNRRLLRREFLLGALLISGGIAVSTGLLGTENWARFTFGSINFAIFIWAIVHFRRTSNEDSPNLSASA